MPYIGPPNPVGGMEDDIEKRKRMLMERLLSGKAGRRNVAGGVGFGRGAGRGRPVISGLGGQGGNRFNRAFGAGGVFPGLGLDQGPGGPSFDSLPQPAQEAVGQSFGGPFRPPGGGMSQANPNQALLEMAMQNPNITQQFQPISRGNDWLQMIFPNEVPAANRMHMYGRY